MRNSTLKNRFFKQWSKIEESSTRIEADFLMYSTSDFDFWLRWTFFKVRKLVSRSAWPQSWLCPFKVSRNEFSLHNLQNTAMSSGHTNRLNLLTNHGLWRDKYLCARNPKRGGKKLTYILLSQLNYPTESLEPKMPCEFEQIYWRVVGGFGEKIARISGFMYPYLPLSFLYQDHLNSNLMTKLKKSMKPVACTVMSQEYPKTVSQKIHRTVCLTLPECRYVNLV